MLKNPKNKKTLKWLLIAGGSLLLIGIVVYFYYATLTHDDTASLKADYTVEAIPFIKEFEKDYKAANKKYAEKIIAVKGIVTSNRTCRHNDEYKDGRYNNRLLFNFCFSGSTHGRSKKVKARRKCSY